MNTAVIKSFLGYYLQSLRERTRREKTGTKWGIDWVIYNLGLAKYDKPVRLPFLRGGDAGYPRTSSEAEFGVDLAFLNDDGTNLYIFVLKDEPLTNTSWTRNDFDRDLRMAIAPPLDAQGLEKVTTVTVILAYNKDEQHNGVELYNRFVTNAPRTLRDTVELKFLRWNLSELVEQATYHLLNPTLVPERFFGQLSYLCAQATDFVHGSDAWEQQLIPNWQRFLQDVLSEVSDARGPLLIPITLCIMRHHAESNPSIQTGWLDLVEWAAIALWQLAVNRHDDESTEAVRRFWREFYVAELSRFYRAYIDDLTTEQAIDQVGTIGFVGGISAGYIAHWHVARLGILAICIDEAVDSHESHPEGVREVANWTVRLINEASAVLRPVLDIQHIEWFLLIEVFRRAQRTNEMEHVFRALVDRLFLRRVGHSAFPFLDANNSLENVFEQVATKPEHPLVWTQSSLFVLMLLELCCLLPEQSRDELLCVIHCRLVLGVYDVGPPGDAQPLDLISWLPPENWVRKVFTPGPEGGQGVVVPPIAVHREATAREILDGLRLLVSRMRAASTPDQPIDIPLSAALLASLRHRKPLPPELWRRWIFPPDEQNAGPLPRSDGEDPAHKE